MQDSQAEDGEEAHAYPEPNERQYAPSLLTIVSVPNGLVDREDCMRYSCLLQGRGNVSVVSIHVFAFARHRMHLMGLHAILLRTF